LSWAPLGPGFASDSVDQLNPAMTGHGPKNIFFDSWPNLRGGRAFPFGADFCGVDRHHRGLVGAEVGKLGSPHCCWWPRPSRVETQPARIGRFSLAVRPPPHKFWILELQTRAGSQHENRQGARHRNPTDIARARRRGDRVNHCNPQAPFAAVHESLLGHFSDLKRIIRSFAKA
jgi:hypothetical protein